ncbi:hypothetical protein GKQ77_19665 [Streptomyces sp. BG9H]|uniref:Uncharacterized protein n=1 Tax=Streptomyces anatolicus TaxID=2675858 RepID=A0ABS6YQQ0_9ACTN|nr:hypothetical protein [Streptomyces anatolicus]MBW5423753.1 hypothetical protein [Streptomyces anatolicus]
MTVDPPHGPLPGELPPGWIDPAVISPPPGGRVPGQTQPQPQPQPPPPPSLVSPEALRNQLDARLAEYATLRQESLQAISNRIQVMNFAFTSLSLILAALLASDVPRSLLILVSLLFVPIASKASALVWLGEYHRSQRAGQGVRLLEGRINELLGGGEHLTWEKSLYSQSTHMGYPYIATVLFILSTGVFGEFLGGIYLTQAAEEAAVFPPVLCAALVVVYSLTIEISFLLFFRKRWIAIRLHSHGA